jgi:hypothetical protein
MVAPPQHSPCPASHPRDPAGSDRPTHRPAVTWVIHRAPPSRPEQRHDLSPHKSSPLSLFSKNRLITKPSRLTLGVAAATVAAVAGVAIATAASPTPGHGLPAALNRAGVSKAAVQRAKPSVHAKMAMGDRADGHAPAGKHAAPAHKAAPSGLAKHPQAAHRPQAAHHRAPAAGPTAPYLVYDSVIPSAIPAHHVAAVYATGPFAASQSQLAGKGPVVWIDTIGSDPAASALDVEPSDATPSVAATWAYNRLSTRPHAVARIYTMISEWPAVKAAIAGLPHNMQSHIRWWIADPTGVAHIVPGSAATQWYWGSSYDISTAAPRF